jgi:hypothetical protein
MLTFCAGWTLCQEPVARVAAICRGSVLERWTEDRFKLQMHIIKDAYETASWLASRQTALFGKSKQSYP